MCGRVSVCVVDDGWGKGKCMCGVARSVLRCCLGGGHCSDPAACACHRHGIVITVACFGRPKRSPATPSVWSLPPSVLMPRTD